MRRLSQALPDCEVDLCFVYAIVLSIVQVILRTKVCLQMLVAVQAQVFVSDGGQSILLYYIVPTGGYSVT